MAPVTRRRQAAMDANSSGAEEPAQVTKTTAKRDQKLALRSRDEVGKKTAKAAIKSNITVFDEEEMSKPVVLEETVTKAAVPVEEEEEEEDESDDDAPETVSTAKVASEIKSAAKVAHKAAQEQATAQKRKRQDRAALLKKQAEERKKFEDVRSSPVAGGDSDNDSESESESATQPITAASRKRGGQLEIPDLLPAEFLTDSSGESDDDDDGSTAHRSKPKRRKVAAVERSLTRLDKGPQDATVGNTVYRVAKKVDERLAPKLRQYSKSTKELLLKRNRAPAKSRGGFLLKR